MNSILSGMFWSFIGISVMSIILFILGKKNKALKFKDVKKDLFKMFIMWVLISLLLLLVHRN